MLARPVKQPQRQLVAIARSLVYRPQLLLADEPTSGLDPELTGKIVNLLIEMTREQNLAVVIATHNYKIARQFDQLRQLSEGRLIKLPAK